MVKDILRVRYNYRAIVLDIDRGAARYVVELLAHTAGGYVVGGCLIPNAVGDLGDRCAAGRCLLECISGIAINGPIQFEGGGTLVRNYLHGIDDRIDRIDFGLVGIDLRYDRILI